MSRGILVKELSLANDYFNVQGDNSGQYKPPINLVLMVLAAIGSLLYQPASQAS